MTKPRDYKKEYAKFQSSTKRKKYRAELNKYNRDKGTYGNGDGKDASHKGGKISGYEAEGKNRGRREKSRLKGSKRKTESVMPRSDMMGKKTFREYIRNEVSQALGERLSKRWNIVEGPGVTTNPARHDNITASLQGMIDRDKLTQSVQQGDPSYIHQAIKSIVDLRRRLDQAGDREQMDRTDDILQNLVRMYMHVKKQGGNAGPPAVTEAADEKDRHGGYYIDTYKGWKIYSLQSYSTPYYYASAQRNPKTGRSMFGPSDNYPGLRRLKNRMDKWLKAAGETDLGEADLAMTRSGRNAQAMRIRQAKNARHILTYKGWKVFQLGKHGSAYYFAQEITDPKTNKKVGGPLEASNSRKNLKFMMDLWLRKMGKKDLNEAEPAWGKPEVPTKATPADAPEPKSVLEKSND